MDHFTTSNFKTLNHTVDERLFYLLADRLGRPVAYDTHYLAVAEHLGCEFWTADERLTNSVQGTLPWVKWLGQTSEENPADNT